MASKEQRIRDALKNRSTLNLGGLNKIKKDLGIKGGVIPIAQSMGIKISQGAKTGGSSSSVGVPGFGQFSSEGFLSPAEFDAQSALNLLNQQGNISVDVAEVNRKGLKEIERIRKNSALQLGELNLEGIKYQTDATYVTDSTERSRKYSDDRQLEGVLGAENIRAKGAIDLQGIINAGAERVENIRGEYGIKGKKIDSNTAMLGALISAFNF
jgi:hypothetical protein